MYKAPTKYWPASFYKYKKYTIIIGSETSLWARLSVVSKMKTSGSSMIIIIIIVILVFFYDYYKH